MYKVLIADGSEEISRELARLIGESCTVHIRQKGESVLQLLEELEPDLVVLDMMLPGEDSIGVLEKLTTDPCRPAVLATVRHVTDYMMEAMITLGVDHIMTKPCIVANMADRVRDLLRYRISAEVPAAFEKNSAFAHARRLGVASNLRGCKYLHEALCQMRQNPNQQITKELYPTVGARFHVSGQRVERCIRNAIHTAWEKRDDRVWRMYFATDANGQVPRPTNAQFIARLLELVNFVA